MRALLRRILEHGMGTPGRALLAWRSRARAERLLDARGVRNAAAAIATAVHGTVAEGPFSGMRYPRRLGDIVHAPKLLGSYERELHAAVAAFVARGPELVINIGSGDGYYAVGLARRLPGATVVAVDPDPLAQRACRATARLNGAEQRLKHTQRVDSHDLERLLAAAGDVPALCVVDCEGYEDLLLDPVRARRLLDCDLLVETHDFAAPGVTSRLLARFAGSHVIERIECAPRDPAAYPALAAVAPAQHASLLDEYRHMPQSWLAMTARRHGARS